MLFLPRGMETATWGHSRWRGADELEIARTGPYLDWSGGARAGAERTENGPDGTIEWDASTSPRSRGT